MKTKNRRIVVVTGGRDYSLRPVDHHLFSFLLQALGATDVYHGGACGVDQEASETAAFLGLQVRCFLPDYGTITPKKAPRSRNFVMLQAAINAVGKESVVLVVFPGGHGTAHAFESAIGLGIQCIDFSPLKG